MNMGWVVDLLARDAEAELVVAQVVHDHRAQDARRGPGGEQAAMDGSHHLGADRYSGAGARSQVDLEMLMLGKRDE